MTAGIHLAWQGDTAVLSLARAPVNAFDLELMAQLQAHLMSHHYPGLLKKANLLGYGRPGSGG